MVNTSWFEAGAFCKFVGGSLPTEAVWEYAAPGRHADWIYPWDPRESLQDRADGFGKNGKDQRDQSAPGGRSRRTASGSTTW